MPIVQQQAAIAAELMMTEPAAYRPADTPTQDAGKARKQILIADDHEMLRRSVPMCWITGQIGKFALKPWMGGTRSIR